MTLHLGISGLVPHDRSLGLSLLYGSWLVPLVVLYDLLVSHDIVHHYHELGLHSCGGFLATSTIR